MSRQLPFTADIHNLACARAQTRARTRFLGVGDVAQIVHRVGLSATIAGVLGRIEADYRRWPDFDKTARVGSYSAHGVIELMPVADARHYAFKFVTGHPLNPARGLPTVMAFGVLADVATGTPLLVSEMTLTTAIRTAAMSALAARVLARPGSRRLALIGNGAQSEFQALAFRDVVGIRELQLFDTDPAASARLAANLAGSGLELRVCADAEQAVRGADIVTTATADQSRAVVITPAMLEPGMHLNAIGGDCPGKTELHPGVVAHSSVFVEFEPQTRVEGDLQQMPADFAVTEFWRVLTGAAPGRRSPLEVTVFDSVGFALEDLSALCWLHEAAQRLGLGSGIDLVPAQPDPKDLYALLRGQGSLPPKRLEEIY